MSAVICFFICSKVFSFILHAAVYVVDNYRQVAVGTLKFKTSSLLHTIGVSTLEYKYINFVSILSVQQQYLTKQKREFSDNNFEIGKPC